MSESNQVEPKKTSRRGALLAVAAAVAAAAALPPTCKFLEEQQAQGQIALQLRQLADKPALATATVTESTPIFRKLPSDQTVNPFIRGFGNEGDLVLQKGQCVEVLGRFDRAQDNRRNYRQNVYVVRIIRPGQDPVVGYFPSEKLENERFAQINQSAACPAAVRPTGTSRQTHLFRGGKPINLG